MADRAAARRYLNLDLLGLSNRRASRLNIRRMASKLLPFNSGRRCRISSRAAVSSTADFVSLEGGLAMSHSCHDGS
jgi:hypothetical protein